MYVHICFQMCTYMHTKAIYAIYYAVDGIMSFALKRKRAYEDVVRWV